jgi:hypothetical protein
MFSFVIVDNASFEEEHCRGLKNRRVTFGWRKASDANYLSTYAIIKNTIN